MSCLLSLDLLGKVLNGLLKVDERHPADKISILSSGFIGKGSGVQKASLSGLGVPLDNGVNLLVRNGDLGRDALESGLLDRSGDVALFIATGQHEGGGGEEGE